MTRSEMARENFRAGYNCAQSVALAFADLIDMDRDALARMASPLGGGMGRLREVCGAVSGMLLVLGALQGYDGPETGGVKAELYAKVQALAEAFEARHGSIVCRELLGLTEKRQPPTPTPRTADFYEKRPCAQCIADAAEILEGFLREQESGNRQ